MLAAAIDQARHAGEKLHRFHGGLHLRHNKQISCEQPIQRTPLPARLFIPLLQQAGMEAQAVVEPGQKVLKGELIGHCAGPIPTFVHASTSGTVTAIARHAISHPSGLEGLCVVLKPDGRDRWTNLTPEANWQSADPVDLNTRIAACGIVGLGGAAFPTGRKIEAARQSGVHTLILNGAECEPYISCDEMLMREQPDSVIAGARILQRACGAEKVIIALEDRMGEVFAKLRAAISGAACDGIQIVKVTKIYPEGGEKQLVQMLTGLEVPSASRPTDLGLLCHNVATAAATADAVIEGRPLIERIVTVTGNGVRHPRNLLALLGTPIAALVEQCGGYMPDAARLVLGGPMMGYALPSDANPVVKAANCILVLSRDDITPQQAEMPCIRCGECAHVCPANLLPQQLHWQVCHDLLDDAAEYGLRDCIECGCCDYVCPSHIPLVEWFRHGKSALGSLLLERDKAAAAGARHAARVARLELGRWQHQRQLSDEKSALRDQSETRRRIAAAVERAKEKSVHQAETEKPSGTTGSADQ